MLEKLHERVKIAMKRVIERDKPKQQIIEAWVKGFFSKHPKCVRAVIDIKEDKPTRSQAQNDLYWAWLGVLTETGYTKTELHKLFRHEHLGYEVNEINGVKIEELRSTKALKVAEFKDYLDQIDRFAAEFGILLPKDKDLYYQSMGVE